MPLKGGRSLMLDNIVQNRQIVPQLVADAEKHNTPAHPQIGILSNI
jgi:hypothetical protein